MLTTKFQYKALLSEAPAIDMLTVCSYEMNVYLVKLTVGQQQGLVYEGDRPKRFHSSQHIRDSFDTCTVNASQMIHESPYDEMIGNPNSAQSNSVMPFSMRQPY